MSAEVFIYSDPDSSQIVLLNSGEEFTAPDSATVESGVLSFKAFKTGYDSLIQEIEVNPGRQVMLRFLLRANKPMPVTAEELGLEFEPQLPLREEDEARRYRQKFTNMAEIFAITPLSQGILAKIIIGGDNNDADILLVSGAILVAGSLILGKILYSKKLETIKEFNAFAESENLLAREHNSNIEKTVTSTNQEAMMKWQQNNKNKGTIIITYR